MLILPILYIVLLHSVFFSLSKYHLPLIGVIAILSGLSVIPVGNEEAPSGFVDTR